MNKSASISIEPFLTLCRGRDLQRMNVMEFSRYAALPDPPILLLFSAMSRHRRVDAPESFSIR